MSQSDTTKINEAIIKKVKELGVSVDSPVKTKHLSYTLGYKGKYVKATFASSSSDTSYRHTQRNRIAKILAKEFGFNLTAAKNALKLMIGTERELTAKQQAALEWWRSELERSSDDRLSDAEIVKRDARNARRRELYRMRKVDAESR